MSETQLPIDRRAMLFGISQLIAWPLCACAAVASRASTAVLRHKLPRFRQKPRSVRPLHDIPELVTDEQLLSTLSRLRLPRATTLKVNHVDHALRMWGYQVAFHDAAFIDGKSMLAILIDDAALRKNSGTGVRPLLVPGPDGIRVRTQEGSATSSHVDHTLATLTEIGLPLNQKVRTRNGVASIASMLQAALRSFMLNQKEYEWTILALAMYCDEDCQFHTKDGERVTFDRLATRMMRESLGHGVCYGGHRLFTLTLLSRIDEEDRRIFSDPTRNEVQQHLGDATRRLMATQKPEGYWDNAWPGYRVPATKELWTQGARLVATGHALEWWSMLPNNKLMPPREVLVRAGQWLIREIEDMEDAGIRKNYTFLTHAGRALSMWRAELPAESWKRLASAKQVSPVTTDTAKIRRRLWNDERGAVMSIEMILMATIMVLGVIVGLATYRDAVVQELGDSAASVASLTQTFSYEGVSLTGTFGTGISATPYDATVAGSQFNDARDFGEAVLDSNLAAPMCIVFDATTVEDEQP